MALAKPATSPQRHRHDPVIGGIRVWRSQRGDQGHAWPGAQGRLVRIQRHRFRAATVGSYNYTAGFVNNAAGAAVQYDAFGSVKAVGTETYLNNPFGERIQRVQNGVTTWLAPWGGKTLLEAEEVGSTKKLRRIYHHDLSGRVLRKREISYEESTPETQDAYYHYDGRSSVSVLTDAQGVLVQKYHYLPYGGLMEGSDAKNRYGFSGKDLVPGTDLLDFGPRFMGPGVGRFLGPDAVEAFMERPDVLNRYLHCRNNPLGDFDLNGNLSLKELGDVVASFVQGFLGAPEEAEPADEPQKAGAEEQTVNESGGVSEEGAKPVTKDVARSVGETTQSLALSAWGAVKSSGAKLTSFFVKASPGAADVAGTGAIGLQVTGRVIGGLQQEINQQHQKMEQLEQMESILDTPSLQKENQRFKKWQNTINRLTPTPVP